MRRQHARPSVAAGRVFVRECYWQPFGSFALRTENILRVAASACSSWFALPSRRSRCVPEFVTWRAPA